MNYEERKAFAIALYSNPPKPDLPNQKFKRGQRVKVADKMPPWMKHFESGFEGIIEYCYAQKFWGNDIDSYCILVLDKQGEPINSIAWYKECQLTLIDENIESGIRLIEKYSMKRKALEMLSSSKPTEPR